MAIQSSLKSEGRCCVCCTSAPSGTMDCMVQQSSNSGSVIYCLLEVNITCCCRSFREKGPFLGRHYLFWHHGRPLTVIYEVFSPKLSRWLGPMHQ